jgi:hypothetical protein
MPNNNNEKKVMPCCPRCESEWELWLRYLAPNTPTLQLTFQDIKLPANIGFRERTICSRS